jgi:protein TonB
MIEFTYEDRRDWARWALSGIIVLTLHVGIAAAMVQWHESIDADEPTAALVVNLAPFPVSPEMVPMDMAPGPEQVEAQAAPETPVERPEEKQEETADTKEVTEVQPEVAPAPDPEIAVAALPPKPEPETPKPQESQAPVPVTTAPQVPATEVAPVAAAPVQGQAHISNSNAIPTWRNRIVILLERHKRYPTAAQGRHEQGTAQLAFSIDRHGRLTSSKILRSSGSTVLDNETLELVRRAQPFPPPPPELPGGEINLSVPIKFNIR